MSNATIRVMSDLIEPHLRWCRNNQGYSDRTVEARRNVLRRADAELPYGVETPSADEVSDWLARYRSKQTKATYYSHLNGFYAWGCDNGHLNWNPMEGLPRPRVPKATPRPVSNDELRFLLSSAADPFRLWIVLAAGAGLRAMEIAALERRDVTQQTITVVCGKGGKTDTVPTHPAIWDAVKDLPPGRVARNAYGGPVTARFISSRFGLYCRLKFGLEGVTLHRFRHWFGTEAMRQGNARVAQVLLRHDSLVSTQIYTKVTDGECRIAISALPVLGAPASA